LKKIITVICLSVFIKQAYGLDLLESYQLALQNNPTLKQAYFEKMAISESKSQSIAKMLPAFSVLAKSSQDRLNNVKDTYQGSGVQNFYTHNLTINFKQPLFHWEHWVELEQSENKIAQAEAKYLAEKQNLIVKTTEAYFTVLSELDNLDIAFSEKKSIEFQLETAKQLFEKGVISSTNIYESQAAFDKAKANIIKAENALNNSIAKLVELIGGNDEVELNPLIEELKLTPPEPDNILMWNEAAMENNLQIISALNQIEVSRKTIEIQESGHYPQLDLVANYGFHDENSSFGFRGDTRSVGVQLNAPLFEGGAVNSKTQQAIHEFEAARENLYKTQKEVSRQVKETYNNVLSSLEQAKAFKAVEDSASKVVNAVKTEFETGTRTMVDVLDEQKKFYQAKRDYSRSLYEYLINGVKLKQTGSNLSEDDLVNINHLLQHSKSLEVKKHRETERKWLTIQDQQNDKPVIDLPAKTSSPTQSTSIKAITTKISEPDTVDSVKASAVLSTPVTKTLKVDTTPLPNDYYTIQIFASGKQEDVSKLMEKWQSNLNPLMAIDKTKNGQKIFVLTYGTYPSAIDANQVIKTLPQEFLKNKPWAIKIVQGHIEAR
jgi:outer membrane protein